jgi:hypothetical protein
MNISERASRALTGESNPDFKLVTIPKKLFNLIINPSIPPQNKVENAKTEELVSGKYL